MSLSKLKCSLEKRKVCIMFSTNGTDYLPEFSARQAKLEAEANKARLLKVLEANVEVSPVRQRVGQMLIDLGKKVAQDPQQDAVLVLSAGQS